MKTYYEVVDVVQSGRHEACNFETKRNQDPKCGESLLGLIAVLKKDLGELYILGSDNLPEEIDDIRFLIYGNNVLTAAYIDEKNCVHYIGIQQFEQSEKTPINLAKLKTDLSSLKWSNSEIDAICRALVCSDQISL